MLLTPHTAVGIAIGAALPNPVISVPLSLLSHFALDLVPHWDALGFEEVAHSPRPFKTKGFQKMLLDGLASLSLLLFFIYWAMPDYGVGMTIAACAFAAVFPDLFYIPLLFSKRRPGWAVWVARLQQRIQASSAAPLAFGLSTQLFAAVVGSLVARQEILIRLPQIWQIL